VALTVLGVRYTRKGVSEGSIPSAALGHESTAPLRQRQPSSAPGEHPIPRNLRSKLSDLLMAGAFGLLGGLCVIATVCARLWLSWKNGRSE